MPTDTDARTPAEIMAAIRDLTAALNATADTRPPLTLREAIDMFPTDHTMRAECAAMWARWSDTVDVTELAAYPCDDARPDEDGTQRERWTRLDSSTRYEVRERTDEDGDTVYDVVDTEGDDVTTEADEDDATEYAERMNREDADESLCAFPFASSYGRVVDMPNAWTEHLTASGLVVYDVDGVGRIAGVDGGGYSFDDQHWGPCFLRIAAACGWTVATDDGPRRVVVGV